MECPTCGKSVPDSSSHCIHCGALLQNGAGAAFKGAVANPDRARLVTGLTVLLLSSAVFFGVRVYETLIARRPTPTVAAATLIQQAQTKRPSETPGVTPATATETQTRRPATPATATETPTRRTATPTLTATPWPAYGRVVGEGDGLNVRKGPGMEYDIITQVHDGDPLAILGCSSSRQWLKARLSDRTEGWVSSKYVEINLPLDRLSVLTAPPPDRSAINPHFRAAQTTVSAGKCTTLRWDIEGIRKIYLDGHGVAGHGYQVVCPDSTQTFTLLVVQRDGRRVSWPLTIRVSGVAPPMEFVIDYRGCIRHELRLGQVKGQVFNKSGHIIVNALVGILVNGQSGVVPVARTNEQGWYEWNLRPGQVARFVRLTVSGRAVLFAPADFEVTARSGCYQRVDFRQR